MAPIRFRLDIKTFLRTTQLVVQQGPSNERNQAGARVFRSTLWTVVLNAGSDSTSRQEAIEKLCRIYWFPLYAFIRRKGYSEADAQDLTQAFFSRLLDKNALAQVSPERGRFRAFLLCSLNNFLANEWDRAHSIKRGGQIRFIPFDPAEAEERFCLDAAHSAPPDLLFDQRWAQETMKNALARLASEFDGQGKTARFQTLKGFLAGDGDLRSYAEAADRLGVTEQAIKGAVHRLRRRLGELLREHIAETVADESMVEQELRHLLEALSN